MKVSDVMTQDIIAVKRSTTLRELIKLFCKFHSFPLVPVIDKNNLLIGVVSFKNLIETFRTTSHDIIKTIPFIDDDHRDIFDVDIPPEIGELCIVDDFMQAKFIAINKDSSIDEAYRIMFLHQCEKLPVVDSDQKIVGMIGEFDILLAIFREKGVIK